MYENLHVHTKRSDGELDYLEVLDVCKEHNISIVAFCDHDSLPSEEDMKILNKHRDHKTKWIVGTELSLGWPIEIGGPAGGFHVLGLFVDPTNKALGDHCRKTAEGRKERVVGTILNLKKLGFNIETDDCFVESKGEPVSRTHIVTALRKNEENLKLIEELRQKMEIEARTNDDVRTEYNKMIAWGPYQYPYNLFLKEDSYIPNILVPYTYYLDMDSGVSLIRNAGGIPIQAHWTFYKNKIPLKMMEDFLKEGRIDGAEITFGLGFMQGKMKKRMIEDMESMTALTEKYDAVQWGGGDSHTREDFISFAQTDWFAKKTIGLSQKMIEKKNPNLKFSSL